MWVAIAGAWLIGSAVFYTCMVRSAKVLEDDVCSLCENRECVGCETCAALEESLRKAA
jgi:hypothetical protein